MVSRGSLFLGYGRYGGIEYLQRPVQVLSGRSATERHPQVTEASDPGLTAAVFSRGQR